MKVRLKLCADTLDIGKLSMCDVQQLIALLIEAGCEYSLYVVKDETE
jgi:hypothetical protein|tara:strand:- start:365 stop:505 length:141 start_codon:yes stop_codon:yes gene_type:complete